MKLSLYLYEDNKLTYQVTNQEYQIIDNIIKFTENNNTYEITLSPTNFIFTRTNPEGTFSFNHLENLYLFTLPEVATYEIPCNYHNYNYNEEYIIYEYQLASKSSLNKIVIERK